MNLWIVSNSPDSPATAAQSQLFWLGDPAAALAPVPEPASFLLWAAVLSICAIYRSRQN